MTLAEPVERRVGAAADALGVGVRAAQDRGDDAAVLLEQRDEHVVRRDLRVAARGREPLGGDQGLLSLVGESIRAHRRRFLAFVGCRNLSGSVVDLRATLPSCSHTATRSNSPQRSRLQAVSGVTLRRRPARARSGRITSRARRVLEVEDVVRMVVLRPRPRRCGGPSGRRASISRPAPMPSIFWKIDPALMRTAPGGCFSIRQRAFMSRVELDLLGLPRLEQEGRVEHDLAACGAGASRRSRTRTSRRRPRSSCRPGEGSSPTRAPPR